MKAEALSGLTWTSLPYRPDGPVDGFAGPDKNERCEAPRHPFGAARPHAEWVELLWYPKSSKAVARCWKTCEECHVMMARSAEGAGE